MLSAWLQNRTTLRNSNGNRSNYRRTRELSAEPRVRHQVLAAHYGPQAHRVAVPRVDYVLLFRRRVLCPRDAAGTVDAGRRSGAGRYLQQAFHHARPGDGVLFPDSFYSRRAGEFPGTPDDRRQRPRVPSHQSAELVPFHYCRHRDAALHPERRRGYWLDLLYALQHNLQQYQGD